MSVQGLLVITPLKGHKISKEKWQFSPTQVWYLGPLILEPELDLDPDRLQGILNAPKPTTKHQWWGFIGLAEYGRNWISNSLLQVNLYTFLKNQHTWPYYLEKSGGQSFWDFKEKASKAPAFGHPKYQLPLFLFVREREENALGVLIPKTRGLSSPHRALQPTTGPWLRLRYIPPCLAAIHSTALLVKATAEIVTGSPLTILVLWPKGKPQTFIQMADMPSSISYLWNIMEIARFTFNGDKIKNGSCV